MNELLQQQKHNKPDCQESEQRPRLRFKLSQASSWLAVPMNESDFTKKTLQHLSSVINVIPGSCHRRFSGWCWLVSLDEPAGCRWRSKQLRGWHARAVSLVPERLKEGALGRDCARRPPCRSGVRSGPGRPAAWRPASSSAGLVPGGGPPARSSELENKQSRVRANTRRLSPEQSGRNFWAR